MKNEIVTAETLDVVELDESMLTLVVGGMSTEFEIEGNAVCPTTNQGCNAVAGCGGKG